MEEAPTTHQWIELHVYICDVWRCMDIKCFKLIVELVWTSCMKMELVACEILQISIMLYSVLLECLFKYVTEASHPRREANKAVSKKIK
jgi:hypothetical protein